jgi:hypothetical protein
MAADRFYGEFYDFYSVSPEYFGHTLLVFWGMTPTSKKEAVRFCETSLNFYQYIQRHIPEERHADGQRRKSVAHRVIPTLTPFAFSCSH